MEKLAVTSNINEGVVARGSKISLFPSANDADIYYTLDGSTPTKESQKYLEPFIVTESIRIKAIAVKDGYIDSDIFSARYIISSNGNAESTNYLTIISASDIAQSKEITIELKNPSLDVALAKFDMYLPDGLRVNNNVPAKIHYKSTHSSPNESEHEIYSAELADDCWRFIICDINNNPITSVLETIKIPVVVENSYNMGNVFLNGIKLVTQNQKFYLPPAAGGIISCNIPTITVDSGLCIDIHGNSLLLYSNECTNVTICDISGRLIMSLTLNANETKSIELESGYYLVNKLKIRI